MKRLLVDPILSAWVASAIVILVVTAIEAVREGWRAGKGKAR